MEKLFTTKMAAQFLNVSKATLARWRMEKAGPAWVKVSSNAVRYRREDLDAWVESRRHEATG